MPTMYDGSSPEETYVSQLDLIERVISYTCRRQRLRQEEADEFRSIVHLKLIDDDYAVLRKFAGQSSLKTFLTTVVQRQLLDYRAAQWGKWRPSAVARRLGPVAVLLEELLRRDGYEMEEAWQILKSRHQVEETRDQIEEMAAQLPTRLRRQQASLEDLPSPPIAPNASPEQRVLTGEVEEQRQELGRSLNATLSKLSEEDRLLLRMRFTESWAIADIARALCLEQRPLYRRIDRLRSTLRRQLEAQGLAWEKIQELF